MNSLYKRFKVAKTNPCPYTIDQDELVDDDDSRTSSKLPYYKQKLQELRYSSSSLLSTEETTHFNYVLEYTESGKIKHPQFYIEATGETYYIPITMDVIRSVILKQHCKITKKEELSWFEDGLRWLSQQQYQNTDQYKYFIPEEQVHTQWDEKRQMLQYDVEDLERSCEAYFGIPLSLCENNWAAIYLMKQATKGNILRRMRVKSNTSLRNFKFNLKRFFCYV